MAHQLLVQQLIQPGEELKSIRRAIQHIGQTQIIGMFIQMPIMIAYETDRATGDAEGCPLNTWIPVPCSDLYILHENHENDVQENPRSRGSIATGRVTRRKKSLIIRSYRASEVVTRRKNHEVRSAP